MTIEALAAVTAFVWTVALEFPIYALALPRSVNVRGALGFTVTANLVTHPVLCVWFLTSRPEFAALAAAEIAVAAIEASLVYAALGSSRDWLRALVFGAAANAFSWGASALAVNL